jgi:hypothetical protein
MTTSKRDIQKARWVTRRANERERVVTRTQSAREVFADLAPGCEVLALTHGQFSMGDAVAALLDHTGPASVSLATWTAAAADIERASQLVKDERIVGMRWLVDRSFVSRQPRYCEMLRERFGDDVIRTTRSHAKFATIRNDGWSLAVRTSMNLNANPRLELIEVSDSAQLADLLDETFDVIYASEPAGLREGSVALPALPAGHETPRMRAGGRVSVGPR